MPSVVGESAELSRLRRDVREFLAPLLASRAITPTVDSWLSGWDPSFSRQLAVRGWVGMTVPVKYGGQGRTFAERFVVTEELLAVGAPVMCHWVADRQIAPSLLNFGTESQRERFLPGICRGETYFGIGMSEPDAGSDLASVRTAAVQVPGGWSVSGTKVWTSGAHNAHFFFVLARTSPASSDNRHGGMSQLIVDLASDGVTVRPIESMSGEFHFTEVHLDRVFVPDDLVLGEIGNGWSQVTSELSFERSGPERFMSTFPLLAELTRAMGALDVPRDDGLGRIVARVAALHQMSQAVSAALAAGERADTAAAVVKVLGTATEGDIAEFADCLGSQNTADPTLSSFTRLALVSRPGYTLRGGTNEILRGVIARGLGLR